MRKTGKRWEKWKSDIVHLAVDNNIPMNTTLSILDRVDSVDKSEMPKFYKGKLNNYKYDLAHREVRDLILDRLQKCNDHLEDVEKEGNHAC